MNTVQLQHGAYSWYSMSVILLYVHFLSFNTSFFNVETNALFDNEKSSEKVQKTYLKRRSIKQTKKKGKIIESKRKQQSMFLMEKKSLPI